MKFLGQGCQKLEPEQFRQTDRQTDATETLRKQSFINNDIEAL